MGAGCEGILVSSQACVVRTATTDRATKPWEKQVGWNDHMDDSELSNLPAEAFVGEILPFEVDDDWLRTADPDGQRTAMREWFLAR